MRRQDTAQHVSNDPPSDTTVGRSGEIKNGTCLNRTNQLRLRFGQLSHKITIIGAAQAKYLDRRHVRERLAARHQADRVVTVVAA